MEPCPHAQPGDPHAPLRASRSPAGYWVLGRWPFSLVSTGRRLSRASLSTFLLTAPRLPAEWGLAPRPEKLGPHQLYIQEASGRRRGSRGELA